MTINHLYLMASARNLPQLRKFYKTVLAPLAYTEYYADMKSGFIGFGSNYPYFWLKALPEGTSPIPTHISFDAKDNETVDEFYRLALAAGGKANGAPGLRPELGKVPYYAAFVLDADGNNLEAVCVDKTAKGLEDQETHGS